MFFRAPSACFERNATTCSSCVSYWATRQQIQHKQLRHQAWLTTYSHLAIINRVEMLERINSSHLSPRHQRHITRCHATGHTHKGGWFMIRADAPLELMKRITRGK